LPFLLFVRFRQRSFDVFAHYRYFFGSRAKVRRIFAKYLQSIAKLTTRKSTLKSITATNEIGQLDRLYLYQCLLVQYSHRVIPLIASNHRLFLSISI